MLGLDIVSQNVALEKQTTELVILASFFSRELSYLGHWYQLLHPHIVGSMPFGGFFWATVYNVVGDQAQAAPRWKANIYFRSVDPCIVEMAKSEVNRWVFR